MLENAAAQPCASEPRTYKSPNPYHLPAWTTSHPFTLPSLPPPTPCHLPAFTTSPIFPALTAAHGAVAGQLDPRLDHLELRPSSTYVRYLAHPCVLRVYRVWRVWKRWSHQQSADRTIRVVMQQLGTAPRHGQIHAKALRKAKPKAPHRKKQCLMLPLAAIR